MSNASHFTPLTYTHGAPVASSSPSHSVTVNIGPKMVITIVVVIVEVDVVGRLEHVMAVSAMARGVVAEGAVADWRGVIATVGSHAA